MADPQNPDMPAIRINDANEDFVFLVRKGTGTDVIDIHRLKGVQSPLTHDEWNAIVQKLRSVFDA